MTKLEVNTNVSEMDLLSRIVLIKGERMPLDALEPVRRLYRVIGGFGCQSSSLGRAVFADSLLTGGSTRWNRSDVLGVVDEDEACALVAAFKNGAAPALVMPCSAAQNGRTADSMTMGELSRTLSTALYSGTPFEGALAKAGMSADVTNLKRILAAFPEIVEKFGPDSAFYQGK